MENNSQIVVIYDGQCRFCQASINWVQQKLIVVAKPFQQTDLSQFGLNVEEASKSVQVIAHGQTLSGASAIAYLLKLRGNRLLSMTITATGPLGRWGYRWVAANRSSIIIRICTGLLDRSNVRHQSG